MIEPTEENASRLASSRLLRGILSGERFLALTGRNRAEIIDVLDGVIAGLPSGLVRTVKVEGPKSASWSLAELVRHIACSGPGGSVGDIDDAFDRLMKVKDNESQILLVVGAAEQLDLAALRFLEMLPAISDPNTSKLQILLTGAPELRERLEQLELGGLRGQLSTFVALSRYLDNQPSTRGISRGAAALGPEAGTPGAGVAELQAGQSLVQLVDAAAPPNGGTDPAALSVCSSRVQRSELAPRTIPLLSYRTRPSRSRGTVGGIIGSAVGLGFLLGPIQISREAVPSEATFDRAIIAKPQDGYLHPGVPEFAKFAPISPLILGTEPRIPAKAESGSSKPTRPVPDQKPETEPKPTLPVAANTGLPGATSHTSEPAKLSTIHRDPSEIVPQITAARPAAHSEPPRGPNTGFNGLLDVGAELTIVPTPPLSRPVAHLTSAAPGLSESRAREAKQIAVMPASPAEVNEQSASKQVQQRTPRKNLTSSSYRRLQRDFDAFLRELGRR